MAPTALAQARVLIWVAVVSGAYALASYFFPQMEEVPLDLPTEGGVRVEQPVGERPPQDVPVDHKDCVGDDLRPSAGGMRTLVFPKMIKTKKGETVCFSYIAYKSRAHRDAVNAKVMKDPLMTQQNEPMPFDLKRMAYGGFKVIVDA